MWEIPRARYNHYYGLRLWNFGALQAALTRVTRSISLLRRKEALGKPGKSATELAGALATLARLKAELVQLENAEDLYDQAVNIRMSATDPVNDAAVASLLIAKADVQRRRGLHTAAGETLRAARTWLESAGNTPQLLGSWHNSYGILCKETGHYDAAQQHYTAAKDLCGQHDAEFAASLHHNLAGLAHVQRRFTEGEPLARRALHLRRAVAGGESVDVAADLSVLGAILVGLDQLEEAENLFHDALATWQNRYGENHYEVAVNLHNLAELHVKQGRALEALEELEDALRIKQLHVGSRHPEVAAIHNNIGVLHAREGRRAAADASYAVAASILLETLGSSHPFTTRCLMNRRKLGGRRPIQSAQP